MAQSIDRKPYDGKLPRSIFILLLNCVCDEEEPDIHGAMDFFFFSFCVCDEEVTIYVYSVMGW